VDFLLVIQGQSEFVRPGTESEELAGQQEETFFVCFDLVVSRRKISKRETPGSVGFRAVRVPAAVFIFDSGPRERNTVCVRDNARAIGRFPRASCRESRWWS